MSNKAMIAAFAATCALAATADTLVFKSGSRLEGEVVRIIGSEVTFKSDDVGEVKVSTDKLASIDTKKPATVQYNDRSRADGVVAMKDGKYTLNKEELDMGDVKAVNPEEEAWHGSVAASGTAARGNTVSEKATVLADVNRRWEKNRLTGNFGYYFAQNGTNRDNKKKTEDRIELSAQDDYFWATKVYSYINGKYERDGINDLQYRYRLGVGMGYQWLDGQTFESTGKWSFNQEVGLTYIKEKYEHASDDDRCAFRYAHHLAWTPRWVDKLSFTHNLEYLPDVSDWAPPGRCSARSSGTTTRSPAPTRSTATSVIRSASATSGNSVRIPAAALGEGRSAPLPEQAVPVVLAPHLHLSRRARNCGHDGEEGGARCYMA